MDGKEFTSREEELEFLGGGHYREFQAILSFDSWKRVTSHFDLGNVHNN